MTARTSPATLRPFVALLAVLFLLLAACGGQPTSEVRTAPPDVVASDAPASEDATADASVAPPSDTPSDTPAPPTATPQPGVPDRPAKVTFKKVAETATRITYRLTWVAPAGVARQFLVFGVTSCLRDAAKYDKKPCVVKGMRIPKASLKQLATVSGDVRTVDISWKTGEAGPGPYRAVLIRATNRAGDSIFAIAWSDTVCWGCTY